MNKGRKTTFDERIEIVEYCIAHDKNYSETSEKYGVSYQQARSYTIKYETDGVEGLQDGRGRRKSEDQMDEFEKLRAENRILHAQKKQAENDRLRIKVVGCRDGNLPKMRFFRKMEEKGACRAENFIRN